MFGPYKKQKKHTPLSKKTSKRFDKEIPQQKREWYKARAQAPDETEEVTEEPAVDSESREDLDAEFETNTQADVPLANPTRLTPANDRLRPPGELPDRMNYSERADGEAEKKSSPKMTELRARVLAEAKAKHRSAEERRRAADFRVAHREAVISKRRSESVDKWESKNTGNQRRKLPIVGLLEVLGILAVVLIGVVLASKFSNRDKRNVSKTSLEAKPAMFSLPDELAERVLERFYQATSVDEMLADVRQPLVVESAMREWHAAHQIEPVTFEILNSVEGMVSTGTINAPDQMWVVALTIQLANTAEPRSVLMERTDEGFKVDWESAAQVDVGKLRIFLERRSTEPEDLRVTITPDDYYNYQFSDNEKWVCFRIGSNSGDESLYGYAARGGHVESKLGDWFYPGETSIPVILTLRFPPASEGGSVEIIDAVQKNWILRYQSH